MRKRPQSAQERGILDSVLPMTNPAHSTTDPCACGVCGTDVPPLIGSILTGTGLTLDAAAQRLLDGEALPALTDVQRRMVEARAERHVGA